MWGSGAATPSQVLFCSAFQLSSSSPSVSFLSTLGGSWVKICWWNELNEICIRAARGSLALRVSAVPTQCLCLVCAPCWGNVCPHPRGIWWDLLWAVISILASWSLVLEVCRQLTLPFPHKVSLSEFRESPVPSLELPHPHPQPRHTAAQLIYLGSPSVPKSSVNRDDHIYQLVKGFI